MKSTRRLVLVVTALQGRVTASHRRREEHDLNLHSIVHNGDVLSLREFKHDSSCTVSLALRLKPSQVVVFGGAGAELTRFSEVLVLEGPCFTLQPRRRLHHHHHKGGSGGPRHTLLVTSFPPGVSLKEQGEPGTPSHRYEIETPGGKVTVDPEVRLK